MYITLEEKDYHCIAYAIKCNHTDNGNNELEITIGDVVLVIEYYINIYEYQEKDTGAWITNHVYFSLNNLFAYGIETIDVRYDKNELEDIVETYFKN